MEHPTGSFESDSAELTCYHYRGGFPSPKNQGTAASAAEPIQRDDPYFILGNYRFTVFPHVSGTYELFSGERVCAKANFDPESGYGASFSSIRIGERNEMKLTEIPDSVLEKPVERRFGCGYAEYAYDLGGGIRLRKLYCVQPSPEMGTGLPALFCRVTLHNDGDSPQPVEYAEGVTARFRAMNFETEPRFPCTTEQPGSGLAVARFRAESDDPSLVPDPESTSKYESRPPAVFLCALGCTRSSEVSVKRIDEFAAELVCRFSDVLEPGSSATFAVATGYAHDALEEVLAGVHSVEDEVIEQDLPFQAAWRGHLPDYAEESDVRMRRELIWNSYVLESMATYNAYFDGTHIPQGMFYDYHFGVAGGVRDYCQHALAACYFNPALARSCLRYLCARMRHSGEIVFVTYGYGNPHIGVHQPSDKQLFFFVLMAEYLRITGDVAVLQEPTAFFPKEANAHSTVLDKVLRAFRYLRDVVGRGSHGLIRAMNSDWNDDFFNQFPINRYSGAESVLNTALACAWIPSLIEQLEQAGHEDDLENEKPQLRMLVESLTRYQKQVREAFDSTAWAGPGHLKRMILRPGEVVGEDNFYLSPHAYALQIHDLGDERKREILRQIKTRLDEDEVLGPRLSEKRYTETDPPGVRINGGFWFALGGACILGVASVDQREARRLLERMSFTHFAKCHPEKWAGQWSALDAVNSSLAEIPGNPGEGVCAKYPLFCAHPHAWPLYIWHRLQETFPQ